MNQVKQEALKETPPLTATPKAKANRPRFLKPVLRFSPTAWAKLLFFRDRGECEIGGFGVAPGDDLLLVQEFATVKQAASAVTISFDDDAVADFFDRQVDAGRRPEQFARIWCHTHPGDSPDPSTQDEETFERVFGRCDWAVLFVLGQGGKTYARLRFSVGPGCQVLIPVEVDYGLEFGPSDLRAWEAEYRENIRPEPWGSQTGICQGPYASYYDGWCVDEWLEGFEMLEPDERQLVLDELAARPDLWDKTQPAAKGPF
jgi:proteasome lid subunit RPN8/RPN11